MSGYYCRNCGKEVNKGAYACLSCGLPPMKGLNFCHQCGAACHQEAVICVKCGVNLENRTSFSHQSQPVTNKADSNKDLFAPQMPKTWLAESILVTLFCCLPFGIVGIINASKVESQFNAGNIDGAIGASEEAKKWTNISFWIGIVVGVIYIIVYASSDSI